MGRDEAGVTRLRKMLIAVIDLTVSLDDLLLVGLGITAGGDGAGVAQNILGDGQIALLFLKKGGIGSKGGA